MSRLTTDKNHTVTTIATNINTDINISEQAHGLITFPISSPSVEAFGVLFSAAPRHYPPKLTALTGNCYAATTLTTAVHDPQ